MKTCPTIWLRSKITGVFLMRRLFAGVGVLGLVMVGACSCPVDAPPEGDAAESGSAASPGVTVPQGHPPMTMPMGERSGTAGMPHGMPPTGMPHGMPPTGMPHGAMAPLGRSIAIGGKLKLKAPEDWVPKRPAVSILQYEFSVPTAEGDETDGRVTVMTAGGSVDANVDRWIGQFKQPDESKTSESAKVEKLEVAGCEVRLVDISGTYGDQRGPFAPPVDRPGYRMLAAIISTPEGNYFVKFYGPAKTVQGQAEAFRNMIEGLGE